MAMNPKQGELDRGDDFPNREPHRTPQGTNRVSAPKHPSKAGKLKHVTLHKADNGYVVTQHHHAGGKGGTAKRKQHVFSDYQGAHDHAASVMREYQD